jgi:molybdopterin converting factor small subunit
MKFKLSGNLLRFSGFRAQLDVDAATVELGLRRLVDDCPDLRPVLLDARGRVRAVHRLFLNGDLLSREDLGRGTGPGDEVTILTAIAGG